MKAMLIVVLLVAIHGASAPAQVTNSKATSSGLCAVSHSGNGDVITIKNCGVGQDQLKKIQDMLRAALSDSQTMNLKLDEMLKLASRPVLQINAPVMQAGGDCTQNVLGGSNNTNNCVPKPVTVSAEQIAQITASLKGLKGKIRINYEYSAPGGDVAATNLAIAFRNAGIEVDEPHGAMMSISCDQQRPQPGLSLNCLNENDPLATAVANALVGAGVSSAPIPASRNLFGMDYVEIMIRKP